MSTGRMIRVAFAVVQLDRKVGFAVTQIQIEVEPTRQEDFLAEFPATGCCCWLLQLPFDGQQKNLNLLVLWRRNFPSQFQCESVDHAVDQLQEGLVVSSTTFSRCLFLLGKGVGTWRSVSSAFPHFGQLGFCLEIITYMRQLLHTQLPLLKFLHLQLIQAFLQT